YAVGRRILRSQLFVHLCGRAEIALTLQPLGAICGSRCRAFGGHRGAASQHCQCEQRCSDVAVERAVAVGGLHGCQVARQAVGFLESARFKNAPEIIVTPPGRIDVVATPIGNMADLSPRAREVLAAAAVIAAEDTRHTANLLRLIGVQRPLLSLHDHNEAQRREELLGQLQRGARVALVSDAGTPLVSDPGYLLIRAALDAGIAVHAVPGASALLVALAVSGLPVERFCFEGFLPARAAARRERLRALRHEPRTLVFFEAPHRIIETLEDLAS